MNRISTIFTLSVLLFAALPSSATERRFSYTYETTTAPKGTFELENWATWSHIGNPGGSHTDLFDFRHELEYGITDRLQASLYIFDWSYNRRDEEGHKARWEHTGGEVVYRMTDPATSFLGSALYGEALIGEGGLELEAKLLLQKNFGAWRVAYNLIVEGEWEGEKFGSFDEHNGEFAQSLGVSYDINKSFSAGAEILHEIPIPNWSATHGSNLFLGPNFSVRYRQFFVTATALFQVTNVEGEPDAQIRVITGFHF